MGKRLVIVGFLLCLGIAVYVFVGRDTASLRRNLDVSNKRDARIVLEEFTYFRYSGGDLQAEFGAKLGQFFEPNVVELDGEIKGERYAEDGTETFGAETGTIFFKANSLNQMMEGSQLVKAEMNGFIEVGMKEHLLSTDYAVYMADGNYLRSNRPVRVDGENRVFTSDDGFIYKITQETLQLKGLVKGVFTPDAK
jgi:hypothetical protein